MLSPHRKRKLQHFVKRNGQSRKDKTQNVFREPNLTCRLSLVAACRTCVGWNFTKLPKTRPLCAAGTKYATTRIGTMDRHTMYFQPQLSPKIFTITKFSFCVFCVSETLLSYSRSCSPIMQADNCGPGTDTELNMDIILCTEFCNYDNCNFSSRTVPSTPILLVALLFPIFLAYNPHSIYSKDTLLKLRRKFCE